MIVLDATTTKLQASLGNNVLVTQPDYFVTYNDLVYNTSFTSGQSNGALNNTTQVDILAAPAASTQRSICYVSIFNRDTVAHIVTVVIDVSGTDRTLYRAILGNNEMLQYIDEEGWSVLDGYGNKKFTSAAAATGAGKTFSYYEPAPILGSVAIVQGQLYFQALDMPYNLNPDVAMIALIISNSTNAGGTISLNLGMYSFNSLTLSLASSTLRTIGYNSTAAASSLSNVSGTKFWSIPTGTWSITPGNWMLAFAMSETSSGTSGTYSHWVNQFPNISMNGSEFGGGASNMTSPMFAGVYTAATNAFPNSVAWTQVVQTNSGTNIAQTPWFVLARTS